MSTTPALNTHYLRVGICGSFAEGYADPEMHVAGNRAATASILIAAPGHDSKEWE